MGTEPFDSVGADRPELSVVIVAYNEQDRIRSCIESVLAACEGDASTEIVLVDSNSTDRTVEYATEYPIAVLRIPSDDLTTPGAGRYVGTCAASGETILFVDGDMTVAEGWLPRARERIQDDGVAAVDGGIGRADDVETISEVPSVRGVALYDAAVLRSMGGFDPQLQSLEDVHLGYRLRAAGYRLLRLPETAGVHPEETSVREPLRRLRAGYTVGPGQVLRRSLGSPRLLWAYAKRFRFRFAMLVWLCLGGGAVLGGLLTGTVWALLSVVGFGGLVSRFGVQGAVVFCVQKFLDLLGLLPGLLPRPQPRESFPLERVEVVAEGPHSLESDPRFE